jgi:hypothetical protein
MHLGAQRRQSEGRYSYLITVVTTTTPTDPSPARATGRRRPTEQRWTRARVPGAPGRQRREHAEAAGRSPVAAVLRQQQQLSASRRLTPAATLLPPCSTINSTRSARLQSSASSSSEILPPPDSADSNLQSPKATRPCGARPCIRTFLTEERCTATRRRWWATQLKKEGTRQAAHRVESLPAVACRPGRRPAGVVLIWNLARLQYRSHRLRYTYMPISKSRNFVSKLCILTSI